MPEYLKLDSRELGYREYWNMLRNWTVLIPWTAKLFGIRMKFARLKCPPCVEGQAQLLFRMAGVEAAPGGLVQVGHAASLRRGLRCNATPSTA